MRRRHPDRANGYVQRGDAAPARRLTTRTRAWIGALLFAVAAACAPTADQPVADSGLSTIPLSIATDQGSFDYTVELALSSTEQARGLMYRQDMARDAGMLFPFDPPRPASFWMRNTYIPLDMIFVKDGRIESIAADAVPLVETTSYRSLGAVDAVLELNAGEAARIGADPGDPVSYQLP
ncbi:MAG: DUF192 domain-containing protein [Pacificimonas sp.]